MGGRCPWMSLSGGEVALCCRVPLHRTTQRNAQRCGGMAESGDHVKGVEVDVREGEGKGEPL